ncbi:DedA family protein [Paenibacillus massiliensis]|uniref:DedA family protein n=1 Tax=Paenibacillus massiliensis TaxID=225917 RepID=UPI000471155F|nr:DedA family protein [Paenibacillus massiliensis]
MISNTLIELIHQYSYLFFFLAFSLGPFGVPIPNEVTILSGAILSHTGAINHWLTYFCILAGLLTAITISYCAGRLFGQRLKRRLNDNNHYQKAELLLQKKGDWAMCIGMFIPIVRYFMPLLVGLGGTQYKKFIFLSYSSAIFWTTTYFMLGTFFGTTILDMFASLFEHFSS